MGVHGFDELTVEPKLDLGPSLLASTSTSSSGCASPKLCSRRARHPSARQRGPPTPEARRCATAFRRLIERQAELAACVANLRRLVREYIRTERRARALENVVLPEIDGSLRFIEEQLDAVDQEEAVRVRNAGAARA